MSMATESETVALAAFVVKLLSVASAPTREAANQHPATSRRTSARAKCARWRFRGTFTIVKQQFCSHNWHLKCGWRQFRPSQATNRVPMADSLNKLFLWIKQTRGVPNQDIQDRKSTRLNSSHSSISYAV